MKPNISVFFHYFSISIVTILMAFIWRMYYTLAGAPEFASRILLVGIVLALTIGIQNMLLTFFLKRKVSQIGQIFAALTLIIFVGIISSV